jgi:hypothetical protein
VSVPASTQRYGEAGVADLIAPNADLLFEVLVVPVTVYRCGSAPTTQAVPAYFGRHRRVSVRTVSEVATTAQGHCAARVSIGRRYCACAEYAEYAEYHRGDGAVGSC